MLTNHWTTESPKWHDNWYNFYGTRSGNRVSGIWKKVNNTLEWYTGELNLFKKDLRFDARETIQYILHELILTSITWTLERRNRLRLYNSEQLIEIYNTATDDRLDPSNRLFDDIMAVLSERNVPVKKISTKDENSTINTYRYNPLTWNSEPLNQGFQRNYLQ